MLLVTIACYDCHFNKAATTMWDFDDTTWCWCFISLLRGVLAGPLSKTTCKGVGEGLLGFYDLAVVHLAWGVHPKLRDTRKISRKRQADGQRGMGLMCDGGLGVCAVWVCF
jgi:hypothetical protein